MDANVSLKQQKNSTFLSIRESLRREKFYFGRLAKVYAREMPKFREFFGSRKFLLLKYLIPLLSRIICARLCDYMLFVTGNFLETVAFDWHGESNACDLTMSWLNGVQEE